MQPDPLQQSVVTSDHQLPASTEPKKAKQTGIRLLVWVALLAFFAAGFVLVLRHHDQTQEKAGGRRGRGPSGPGGPAVAITTATAQRGNIGVYVDAIGTVTPVYTANITSQANGLVTAVHYREGQLVHKGDPLIDIDPRPYEATLMQAQGTLQKDEGLLAQAQMDYARYQAAWARNAIQKQQVDDEEKVVEQDKGVVKNDEGTVQYDQVQLGFCHIVSPITGRVGLRLVDPGNVVSSNSGTVLAVVTQVNPITVVFTVAEDSLGQIEPRLRKNARLSVEAFDRTGLKKIATGTLLTLDNQVDTTTGTIKARASFDNREGALFPNQFVNTRLLVNTLVGATLIPTGAVQHNGQAAFVYVIEDGKAYLRPITVGVTDGQTAEVTGINPGDVIAMSSFDRLQDKTPITAANRPGQGGRNNASGEANSSEGASAPEDQGTGAKQANPNRGNAQNGSNRRTSTNAPGGSNTP